MLRDQRFWKRFRKNKAALFSGSFILLLVIMALFAYPLSPDDSEDANTMVVEIAAQTPGFSCLFYKQVSDREEERKGFSYLLHGRLPGEQLIPIRSAWVNKDQVFLQHIMDGETVDTLMFTLPLDAGVSIQEKESFVRNHTFKRIFWLGTDKSGRDMLSRLIQGSRVTLSVGIIAVLLSVFIGVLFGAWAGYFGGWREQFISWLIHVIWSVPTILLVFAISFVLGKGFWQIFIAIGCTMWVGTARMIRGQVKSIRELDYIQSARVMGYSSVRIIFKHILPNVMGQVVVMAAANFATAILIEAGLSFLGIGIQPPTPSWGYMIKENYNFIITNRPFLAIIPGIAIMLTVLAFNLLGNALRDAFDVKGEH